jgi:hypothetical protein
MLEAAVACSSVLVTRGLVGDQGLSPPSLIIYSTRISLIDNVSVAFFVPAKRSSSYQFA